MKFITKGGDCECLCTALSAYAHSCAIKGIHIKWRTPDLCRKKSLIKFFTHFFAKVFT